ncbi:MAG: MogA/MoaB family molybdenum cofactor biosynthesis protein [Actinobacteria bacterium]|nr:MogA/MoaB family molybdenum cofactor biosynthesis protein [Actinomycetota bacterium]
MSKIRTAFVITTSDRASAGEYQDLSGEIISNGLTEFGYQVLNHLVIPDDFQEITSALTLGINQHVDLIVTTGGTGISPRDVTPDATAALIEKSMPGIPEALRAHSREKVPTADLSRGVAGINGKSLIINLPGSPNAARDGLLIIERLAPHIHDQLSGHDHS